MALPQRGPGRASRRGSGLGRLAARPQRDLRRRSVARFVCDAIGRCRRNTAGRNPGRIRPQTVCRRTQRDRACVVCIGLHWVGGNARRVCGRPKKSCVDPSIRRRFTEPTHADTRARTPAATPETERYPHSLAVSARLGRRDRRSSRPALVSSASPASLSVRRRGRGCAST